MNKSCFQDIGNILRVIYFSCLFLLFLTFQHWPSWHYYPRNEKNNRWTIWEENEMHNSQVYFQWDSSFERIWECKRFIYLRNIANWMNFRGKDKTTFLFAPKCCRLLGMIASWWSVQIHIMGLMWTPGKNSVSRAAVIWTLCVRGEELHLQSISFSVIDICSPFKSVRSS